MVDPLSHKMPPLNDESIGLRIRLIPKRNQFSRRVYCLCFFGQRLSDLKYWNNDVKWQNATNSTLYTIHTSWTTFSLIKVLIYHKIKLAFKQTFKSRWWQTMETIVCRRALICNQCEYIQIWQMWKIRNERSPQFNVQEGGITLLIEWKLKDIIHFYRWDIEITIGIAISGTPMGPKKSVLFSKWLIQWSTYPNGSISGTWMKF